MSYFNQPDIDYISLDAAASYIGDYCRKWGRIAGQAKEKYGTVRFYAIFGNLTLHTLIYPGYHHSQFPKWLWKIDITIIGPILQFLFEKQFIKHQHKTYNRAYQHVLKKYPHIREQILVCADYLDIIEGATRIEGNKIHIIDESGNILATRVCH